MFQWISGASIRVSVSFGRRVPNHFWGVSSGLWGVSERLRELQRRTCKPLEYLRNPLKENEISSKTLQNIHDKVPETPSYSLKPHETSRHVLKPNKTFWYSLLGTPLKIPGKLLEHFWNSPNLKSLSLLERLWNPKKTPEMSLKLL